MRRIPEMRANHQDVPRARRAMSTLRRQFSLGIIASTLASVLAVVAPGALPHVADLTAHAAPPVQPTFGAGTNIALGFSPYVMTTGNFMGKGRNDVAVAGGTTLAVIPSNGDGTFGTAVTTTLPSGAAITSPNSTNVEIAAGDVNGDGKQDLALVNGSNTLYVLLGNGNGTFQAAASYASARGGLSLLASVVIGVLRVGSLPDIVVGELSAGCSTACWSVGADVYLNNQNGTFGTPAPFGVANTYNAARGVAIGDITGDGIPDIVIGADNCNATGGVYVLAGDATGNFALSGGLQTTECAGRGVRLADLNGDGKLDAVHYGIGIYFYDGGRPAANVLLNNGSGGLNAAVRYQAANLGSGPGGGPKSEVIADLNGNGRPDIITTNMISGDNSVSVLTNNGDGTFQTYEEFAVDAGPIAVAAVDFNGDGRPDIVSANPGGSDLTVLLNTSPVSPPFDGAPPASWSYGGGSGLGSCACLRSGDRPALGNPVDVMTGNFWHTFTDVDIAGRGIPLNFSHTYNSLAAKSATAAGLLGWGWTFSANPSLANMAGTVTMTEANGAQDTFVAGTPVGGVTPYTTGRRVIAVLTSTVSGGLTTYVLKAHGGQETDTFNNAGQVTKQTDRNGYDTTYTYNGTNQLATVTQHNDLTYTTPDPNGRSLALAYYTSGANTGMLHTVTDTNVVPNRQVTFAYDASSNLTDVTDVAGGNTHFTYDANHELLTMRDPRANTVTNHYDSSFRIDWQKDQLLRQTSYSYAGTPMTAAGGTTTVTDAKSNVMVDTFTWGLRTAEERGHGTAAAATTHYVYDPNTLGAIATTDPNGHTTTSTYDASGNPSTVTDPLGNTTTMTYNAFNEPLTVEDPNQVITTMTYDANGNLLTTSTPLVGTPNHQVTTNHYGDAAHPGDVTSVDDPDGKTTTMTYNTHGDRITSTDPLTNKTTATYNADGWLTTSISPKGAGGGSGASTTQLASGGIAGATGWSTALTSDGTAWSWGYNADGELGNGTTTSPNTSPAKVCAAGQTAPCTVFLSGVASVASEQKTGIAAKSDGTVWDWGFNGHGQLGTGACCTASTVPVQATGLTGKSITAVAGGIENSIALSSTGNVYEWGLNSSGELGDGTTTARSAAVEVCAPGQTAPCSSFLSNITAIAAHKRFVMALTSSGNVYTWGANDKGQLGNGLAANVSVPVEVCAPGQTAPCSSFLSGITSIAADQSGAVARKSDGTVYVWGLNDVGELANGTTDSLSHPIPAAVTGLSGVSSISAGKGHVLAILADGTMRSWGGNTNGQLGIGSVGGGACGCKATVQTVSTIAHVSVISAGETDSLAVTTDGKTWSWGGNANGELGNGTSGSTNVLTPTVFTGLPLPSLFQTSYGHDSFGNVTTVTDPLNHSTTTHYDADQNKDWVQDGNGNKTTYTYDAANELTTTTRPDTTTTVTDYNLDGTVADQKDGKGNAIQSFGYDSLARVTAVTDALGHVTTYTLDGAGNRLTQQDPVTGATCTGTKVGCTTSTYDADNRPLSVSYSDGVTPNVSGISYDGDGQRTAMTDGTGTSTWVYDSLHRVTSYTNGNGAQVQDAYNLRNLPTTITYPGTTGAVTRAYDDAGRLTSVQDWNGNQTTFGYDPNSNLTTTTLPTGTSVVDTATFDNANHLSTIADAKTGTNFFAATYTRDSNNQLSSDNSVPAAVGSFRYTSLNQLCYAGSSSATACASPPTSSFAYKLDTADNLTQTQTAAHTGVVTQAFNAADELCWTVTGASGNACGSVPTGATTYGYDNLGDRTSATTSANVGTCDGYDQARRVTSIRTGTGSSCSSPTTVGTYAYNAGGVRTSKTIGASTTQYAWDSAGGGGSLLQEKTGAATTSYIYGPGGLPLEQITPGGATYYYHHDQLGSTRALTDATGVAKATYTYDPYGNVTACTGTTVTISGSNVCTGTVSVTNPLAYSGQYRDDESGLYYLRARYYDPTTAQFMSLDPMVAATLSPFGYVSGNPLNGTDPTGLCGLTDLSDCVHQAANALGNVAQSAGNDLHSVATTVSNYTRSHIATVCVNGMIQTIVAQGSDPTAVSGLSVCVGISGNGIGVTATTTQGHGFSDGVGVNLGLQDGSSVAGLNNTKGQVLGGSAKIGVGASGDLQGSDCGEVTGAEFGYGAGVAWGGYSGTTQTNALGWDWWH